MSEDISNLIGKCMAYKSCHVVLQTYERALLEGILLELDSENAILLTPEDLPEPPELVYEVPRDGSVPFGPRYRRYNRIVIPFSSITAVYLYPYHYPSFPYVYSRNNSYNLNYYYNPYGYQRNYSYRY